MFVGAKCTRLDIVDRGGGVEEKIAGLGFPYI